MWINILISNSSKVTNFSFQRLLRTEIKKGRNLFTVSFFIFAVKCFKSETQGTLIHHIKNNFGKSINMQHIWRNAQRNNFLFLKTYVKFTFLRLKIVFYIALLHVLRYINPSTKYLKNAQKTHINLFDKIYWFLQLFGLLINYWI